MIKPNVIFIVVDCLRSDVLYGEDRSTVTPNIDRLKKNGIFFKNTISSSTSTLPCFGSIITGLYPFNHGLRDLMHLKIKKDAKTLGELFKENGYNTYAFVTGSLFPAHGFSRGFDTYEQRELWDNLHSQWYIQLLQKFQDGFFKEPYLFFLHIWDLHQPRFVERDLDHPEYGDTLYERSVSSIDCKLGKLFDLTDDNSLIILTGDHGEKMSTNHMEELMDRAKCLYYPNIRWKRKKLHRKLSKIFRSTLDMMKGSDSEFGATHGYQLYKPLITTPLIVKAQGISNGATDRLVRHVDILPSLCKYLFNIEGDFDGVPLFNQKSFPKDAYSEIFLDNELCEDKWLVSLVTDKYQLIFKPYDTHAKIYDLSGGEIEKEEIERMLLERVEEINSEVREGYLLDSRVDMDREIIENKLRSVGYLD